MTAREVGQLVTHLPLERRVWLLDQITLYKQLAWLECKTYNRPLCDYTEARLRGRQPTPITHHLPRNGPVVIYI